MVQHVKYDVVKTLGKIEIRHYKPIVIARVLEQDGDAFNILFRFIAGNNRKKAKVEMTAPVISENIDMTAPVLSDSKSMAFAMPENFRLETTPEPIDQRVEIQRIPERDVAVLRFSGRWTESSFKKKSEELLEELRKAGVKTKGTVFAMLYNSPFTPWFMRRNEVAAEVLR
jgi:effector-binding domain-containing protein